ncbi:putative phosphoglycerate mutase [Labedella gwakjiensis]|uniref:Histidine phosphatase family protein n=1 Tax=Labedella gwakjiensis TaxID=390269 RepID=A0A2P8GR92_9MICO|nr:histidine phosphatase family protein [Labedella gwakjiensis]PSL36490.1 putative phosphoglycerate mutase [Labedella gwakjiensis]RUQ85588.1 histidine phosphatase family protein [Labedella gwakjiensis]
MTDSTEPTGRIVLVRHGETEWSRSGRHTGTTDLPLTDIGEQQAALLRSALDPADFGLVLSSPLGRARRTAELAGFADPVIEPDLTEWDYGAYEGRTTADISAELGRPWNLWSDGVPAGATPGESAHDLRGRADAVLRRARAALPDGDVILFAHGHMLRAIAIAWVALPPDAGSIFALSTSTLSELGFEHGRPAIRKWNAPIVH